MDMPGRRPGRGVPSSERKSIVDDKGTNAASDQGCSPMMKEMMQGMCACGAGARASSPAAMCRDMMSRMCCGSSAPAQGTPEVQKHDEKA